MNHNHMNPSNRLDAVHVIPGDSKNKIVELIVQSKCLAYGVLEIYDLDPSMRIHCEEIGVSHFSLGFKKKKLIRQFITLLLWVYVNKPRVLFLHSFYPSVFGIGLFFLCPFTKSVSVRHHNQVHLISENRKAIYLDKLVSRFTHRTVAVSKTVRDTLIQQNCRPNKIDIIHNGLELSRVNRVEVEANRKVGTLKLLAAGRLDWQKNYELMLSIAAELKNQKIDFHLSILGNGHESYREQLFTLSDQLELKAHVSWLGWQPDIEEWLSQSHIFIHTALDEACPLVLIEALLFGIPIVSSRMGGSGEILSDFYPETNPVGVKCFTSQIIDTWNELSISSESALNNRTLAVEKYGAETMRHKYEVLTLSYLGRSSSI